MNANESSFSADSDETATPPASQDEKKTPNINIIKVRDDHVPLQFIADENQTAKFKLTEGIEVSWLSSDSFGSKDLRNHIEPWLTSLFQSEHLSLLAGSSLTHAIHYLATGKGAAGMNTLPLSNHRTEINQATKKAAIAAGRKECNLEDQLRVANELLRGFEILQKKLRLKLFVQN
ncbi:hypothetical protein ACLECX_15880 [Lonsdalea quercina]|uniref:Uncharacterized protein n=1 Tax=Lonsdalea quercina TaxID=71657 RepID=A0A1H4FNV3_9GAMM|nr:hypothetical protein [Lonsdalea quercina]SEA99039.1 hypothetical protein SAMN02982996_03170 [Lonsdalea quercina]